jgi:serine/threonine protein kinase
MNYLDAANVPYLWEPNDVILDIYEVQTVTEGYRDDAYSRPYHEGGFGRVYKIWNRSWNRHMAVKTPKPGLFETIDQKQKFLEECETWINLGIHPNLSSCHYVRDLGGVPRLFSEYADAGTLSEWISSHRLYEGESDEILVRILDCALQFARGLEHAHKAGVIHKDVKPMNALMWQDGTLKVSDFGISGKRVHAATDGSSLGTTFFVTAGPMTPSHCSPEQAANMRIDKRTDIWSWALCVFEMFNGGVSWASGKLAAHALNSYIENGSVVDSLPSMPQSVCDLLRKCFEQRPESRPQSLEYCAEEIEIALSKFQTTRNTRPKPMATGHSIANVNNKALSLIDLGKNSEALDLLSSAANLTSECMYVKYNLSLLKWRNSMISDNDLISSISNSSKESELRLPLLALIHAQLGYFRKASEIFQSISVTEPAISHVQTRVKNHLARNQNLSSYSINTASIGEIKDIAFLRSSKELMLLADSIYRIDLQSKIKMSYDCVGKNLSHIEVIQDDEMLLGYSRSDREIHLWNLNCGSFIKTIYTQGRPINVFEIPAINKLMVRFAYDNTSHPFSPPLAQLEIVSLEEDRHCFDENSRHILFGSKDIFGSEKDIEFVKILVAKGWKGLDFSPCLFDYPHQIFPEFGDWIYENIGIISHFDKSYSCSLFLLESIKRIGGKDLRIYLVFDSHNKTIERILHSCESLDNALYTEGRLWRISPDGEVVVGTNQINYLQIWNLNIHENAPYLFMENEEFSVLEARSIEFEKQVGDAMTFFESGKFENALASLKRAREIPGYLNDKKTSALWHSLKRHIPIKGIAGFQQSYIELSGETLGNCSLSGAIDVLPDGGILLAAEQLLKLGTRHIIMSNAEGHVCTKNRWSVSDTAGGDVMMCFVRQNGNYVVVGGEVVCMDRIWKRNVAVICLDDCRTRLIDIGDYEIGLTNKVNEFAVSQCGRYLGCSRNWVKSNCASGINTRISLNSVTVWELDTLREICIQLDKRITYAIGLDFLHTDAFKGIVFGCDIGVYYYEYQLPYYLAILPTELKLQAFALSETKGYFAFFCGGTTHSACGHLKIYEVSDLFNPVCLHDLEFYGTIKKLFFVESDEIIIAYTLGEVIFVHRSLGQIIGRVSVDGGKCEKFGYNREKQEFYFPMGNGFHKLQFEWVYSSAKD